MGGGGEGANKYYGRCANEEFAALLSTLYKAEVG